MIKALRREFYKLFHSPLILIAMAAVLALNVYISSRVDVMGAGEFLQTYEDFQLETVKRMVGLPDSAATDLYELYLDTQPRQFCLLMIDRLAMILVCAVLPAVMICGDFRRRSFNNGIYTGVSRTSLYFSKILVFYISAAVVLFASGLLLTQFFADSVFSRLPASYVWGRLLLHLLLDLGIISVPMLLAFLVRRPFPAALCGLAWTTATYFAKLSFESNGVKASQALWVQGPVPASAVIIPVCAVVVSVLVGWLCFIEAKLK